MAGNLLLAAAAVGAAAGGTYLGISYMSGKLLQSQPLQIYTKIEIEEFALSAILVLLCLGLMQDPGVIFNGLAGTPQGIAKADLILHNTSRVMFEDAKTLSGTIFDLSMIAGYSYSYGIPLFLPATYAVSSSPNSGAYPLINSVSMAVDNTFMLALLVRAEHVIFLFLTGFLTLEILLPMGLLLRFIPPMRKLAGLLIAIGLAGYFVLPIAVIWGNDIYSYVHNEANRPGELTKISSPIERSIVCNEIIGAAYKAGEGKPAQIACSLFPVPGSPSTPPPIGPGMPGCAYVLSILLWVVKFLFNAGMSLALPNGAVVVSEADLINNYFLPLQNNFMPYMINGALAAMATIVFHLILVVLIAKNLSEFFGSEGQIYGISKLV